MEKKIHEIGERAYFRVGEAIVSCAQEMIGPERAAWLLEREHDTNRSTPKTVDKYAAQMDPERGCWRPSPEPIVLSSKPAMIDGGNRMRAIRRTGTTYQFTVWYDWPDDIFGFLNRGKMRTFEQAARMAGDALPRQCYQMARLMVCMDTGKSVCADSDQDRRSQLLLPAWTDMERDLIPIRIAGSPLRVPACLALCLAWLTNPAAARNFVAELGPASEHRGVPSSAVRNFLRWYEGTAASSGGVAQRATAFATASALRQYATGVQAHHIKPAPDAYAWWRKALADSGMVAESAA